MGKRKRTRRRLLLELAAAQYRLDLEREVRDAIAEVERTGYDPARWHLAVRNALMRARAEHKPN